MTQAEKLLIETLEEYSISLGWFGSKPGGHNEIITYDRVEMAAALTNLLNTGRIKIEPIGSSQTLFFSLVK